MSQKIAVVTGANAGLGYFTTIGIAKEGYKVIMACRSQERADRAMKEILAENPEFDLEVMIVDLSKLQSVKDFAKEFRKKYKRLDLLVNNAGIMLVPEAKSEDGFEMTMAANYFGHFLLTGLLLDLITKTEHSRIVSLSSNGHKAGKIDFDNLNAEQKFSSFGQYTQSKLACLMYSYELQRLFDQNNITNTISVAAHPGASDTELSRHIPGWLITVLRPAFSLIMQSAEAGALPTLMAALDPDIIGGDYTGPSGFQEMKGDAKLVESTHASHDPNVARQLWRVSEELTGYTYKF